MQTFAGWTDVKSLLQIQVSYDPNYVRQFNIYPTNNTNSHIIN